MQKGRILLSFFIVLDLLFFFLLATKIYAKSHKTIVRTTSVKLDPSPTLIPTLIPKSLPKVILSITPIPALKPVPSLTPTQILASVLTPTATPTPTKKPTPTPSPLLSFSIPDYILNQVNQYRKSKGLSSVTTNSETCAFAITRAKEVSSAETFNHDGFTSRVSSKTLPYPSYHEVTENIAYNTDYTDVVNTWIASPGHEENMRKDTPYVCIGKYGDYYTFEGWRP